MQDGKKIGNKFHFIFLRSEMPNIIGKKVIVVKVNKKAESKFGLFGDCTI
jgi:hypothetical protein